MPDKPEHKPKSRAPPPPPEHRWRKGQSGNPGGRPKGIATLVREMTDDGRTVLQLMADVASGKIKGTTKDRIEAGKVLLERGFGRAVDVSVSLSATAGEETMAALADGALEGLVRQLMSPGAPAALSAQAVDESVEDAVYTPIQSEPLAPAPLSSRDAESPDVPSAPLGASVVPDKDRTE